VKTPIGSSLDEVVETIEAFWWWDIDCINYSDGFLIDSWGNTVGEKSVGAYLGSYFSLRTLTTPVSAYWGFDSSGRLINVLVRKEPDFAVW